MAMADALMLFRDLVHFMRLRAHEKVATTYIAKTFTAVVTLSASSGAVATFPTESLQNERYPFALKQVDCIDTASTSNWGLRLYDKATGWALFGGQTAVSSNAIRGLNQPGGTEKTGQPTGLGELAGEGYIIGPEGGFLAQAISVGTATTAELTLRGNWILEW